MTKRVGDIMTDHPHLIVRNDRGMWTLEMEEVGIIFSMGTFQDMIDMLQFIQTDVNRTLKEINDSNAR